MLLLCTEGRVYRRLGPFPSLRWRALVLCVGLCVSFRLHHQVPSPMMNDLEFYM